MALLDYNQLKEKNLKGYSFSVRNRGMNMTSRNGGSNDYYVVLEDKGNTCIVADLHKRNWVYEWTKEDVVRAVSYSPVMTVDKDTKEINYKIESL